MQERELNCVTIGVASSTGISGKAIAEETYRGSRIGKERSFGRTPSLSFLGAFTVASLFIVVAPLPARADSDNDSRHGHEDNDKGIRAEIAALQAQVAALQDQVNTLQTTNTDQQKEINSLQTSNTTLQKQLATIQSNHALLLGPFVNVDPNPEIGVIGPNIVFSGANIHIVSGSGATNETASPTGLGNLIIGYDEDPSTAGEGGAPDAGIPPIIPLPPLAPGDRGGSHNLVIGRWNRFPSAFGGFVAGEANTIVGQGPSVSGGAANTADSFGASVSGGRFNTAGSPYSSVSGGQSNIAAFFGGGHFGFGASVSGGTGNHANGTNASVCGGENNTAFDNSSTVSGGSGNIAGSQVNFFGGIGSSVLGGTGNNAGGRNSVVIGGQNVTDNNDNSIAPKPPFP
jgi:FtsZ-binding cell division protein ZapB